MEVQITSRHAKAPDSLKDTITWKLYRLERFFDKITSCHVIIDTESINQVVEIVINCLNHTVRAKAKEENIGKALDEAIDKAEIQLKKINTKIKGQRAKKKVEVKE